MINRETGLASDPVVETALKAIADWVTNYRNAIGFNSEFGTCGPDEVMRSHRIDAASTDRDGRGATCPIPPTQKSSRR